MSELWCVNVQGPDDVHAAPSKEAAEKRADELNAFFAKGDAAHADDPHWPHLKAVVVPWMYSAESHAKGLLKWNEP